MPRFMIPPKLAEADHQKACRLLFRNPMLPGDLGRRAVLLRHQRIYLPFYLLTGKRGGVIAVGKERMVTKLPVQSLSGGAGMGAQMSPARYETKRTDVIVEEDSRVVLGDFHYAYSASALENWDVLDTDLKDMVAAHLDEAVSTTMAELARDADVVDVDIPLDRIVDKGVGAGPSTQGDIKILEMRTALVYLPVAVFTFRYGGEILSAARDEVEGRWLMGQLPFRKDWAPLLALPIMAGLGFVGGNALALLSGVPGGEWAGSPQTVKVVLVAGGLLGLVLVMGLQAAWLILRTPYVARLTPSGLRVEAAGTPPKNPFGPLNTFAAFMVKAMVQGRRRERWIE